MKWRIAEPRATPTVASPTAMSGGWGEARVVTSPKRPAQPAGQREQKRREAERFERRHLSRTKPAQKPATAPKPVRAEARRDEEDEHQVRVALGDLDPAHDRDLHEHGREEQSPGLRCVETRHLCFLCFFARTTTEARESKSTRGAI